MDHHSLLIAGIFPEHFSGSQVPKLRDFPSLSFSIAHQAIPRSFFVHLSYVFDSYVNGNKHLLGATVTQPRMIISSKMIEDTGMPQLGTPLN